MQFVFPRRNFYTDWNVRMMKAAKCFRHPAGISEKQSAWGNRASRDGPSAFGERVRQTAKSEVCHEHKFDDIRVAGPTGGGEN